MIAFSERVDPIPSALPVYLDARFRYIRVRALNTSCNAPRVWMRNEERLLLSAAHGTARSALSMGQRNEATERGTFQEAKADNDRCKSDPQ